MMVPWRRSFRTPAILLAINLLVGVLAAGVVQGYAGRHEVQQQRLAGAMQNLTHRRATAADDRAFVAANGATYRGLLARGLLAAQDRLAAARLLERLRGEHGLVAIHYSFSPEHEAPLGTGRLAQLTVVTTEVTIDLSALTDLDALAFMAGVAAELPGDVRIETLHLERLQTPEPALLTRLRAGEPVALVAGQLRFAWRTLRQPDAQIAERG